MTACLGKLFKPVLRERISICMCSSFSFGLEDGMWALNVLILDHCFSIYFSFWFHHSYLLDLSFHSDDLLIG